MKIIKKIIFKLITMIMLNIVYFIFGISNANVKKQILPPGLFKIEYKMKNGGVGYAIGFAEKKDPNIIFFARSVNLKDVKSFKLFDQNGRKKQIEVSNSNDNLFNFFKLPDNKDYVCIDNTFIPKNDDEMYVWTYPFNNTKSKKSKIGFVSWFENDKLFSIKTYTKVPLIHGTPIFNKKTNCISGLVLFFDSGQKRFIFSSTGDFLKLVFEGTEVEK